MSAIYLFYLKKEKVLYAHTQSKELADRFKHERNMNLFIMKKEKMESPVAKSFGYKYRNIQLICIPLSEDGSNFDIVGTGKEDELLSESCDEIRKNMEYIRSYFLQQVALNDKYYELITKLTNVVTNQFVNVNGVEVVQYSLSINTFTLFYYLFKNTFSSLSNEGKYNSKGE